MKAADLTTNLINGEIALWDHEQHMIDRLTSLFDDLADAVAENFRREAVNLDVVTAAAPKFAPPPVGRVLDVSSLADKVDGAIARERASALSSFAKEMPSCALPRSAKTGKWDEKWVDSLSDDEAWAVSTYRTKAYVDINNLARGYKIPADKIEEVAGQIELLDSALAKAATPTEQTLWRAISDAGAVFREAGLSPRGGDFSKLIGKEFRDLGFVSTSRSMDSARYFLRGKDQVLFRIHLPKGMHVAKVTDVKYPGVETGREQEYLLPRGTRFKITNVSRENINDRVFVAKYKTVIDVEVTHDGYTSTAAAKARRVAVPKSRKKIEAEKAEARGGIDVMPTFIPPSRWNPVQKKNWVAWKKRQWREQQARRKKREAKASKRSYAHTGRLTFEGATDEQGRAAVRLPARRFGLGPQRPDPDSGTAEGARLGRTPSRGAANDAVLAAGSPCGPEGIKLSWDVASPFHGAVIEKTGSQIDTITSSVRSDVQRVINKGYESGLSVHSTALNLRDTLRSASPGRAETIARTELSRLANGASLTAVQTVSQAAGVGYMKRWMTAPGAEHPRHEDYEGLDGQTVELNEMFDVGGSEFAYPGDPDGDPGDSINCRCSMEYIDQGDQPVDLALPDMEAAASPRESLERGVGQLPAGLSSDVMGKLAEVRATLAASAGKPQITPTFELTQGGLAQEVFYERLRDAGYTEVQNLGWPCEATHVEGDAVFRDGEACIFIFDGVVAYAAIWDGVFQLSVAGNDRDKIDATFATFQEKYQGMIPSGDCVQMSFWSYGRWGPSAHLRAMAVSPWADISGNYNAEIHDGLQAMMEGFEPGKHGQLLLWQGPPGTGKTWALRALASEWREWAEFHYITDPDSFFGTYPDYMVEVLLHGNPDDENGKWRVLILEDTGELLAENAKTQSGQALSRLLNVVDGLIGQGLRVLVLVTTNDELDALHPAVSRPGRCAVQLTFGKLNPDEATAWLGAKVEEPVTLAELYSLAESLTTDGTNEEEQMTASEELATGDCAGCDHSASSHAGDDNMGACSSDGCDCKGFEAAQNDEEEGDEAALAAAAQTAAALFVPHPLATSAGTVITSFTFNGETYVPAAQFQNGWMNVTASNALLPSDTIKPLTFRVGADQLDTIKIIPSTAPFAADEALIPAEHQPTDVRPEAVTGDVPAPDVEQRTNAAQVRWHAIFAPEGKATDDGRIFAPGSIGHRDLPLSLMAMTETPGEGGHAGAVLCGRIDSIYRDETGKPTLIESDGVFNDSDDGHRIAGLVEDGSLTGNSVDLAVLESKIVHKADVVDDEGFWLDGVDIADVAEISLLDLFFGEVDSSEVLFVIVEAKIGMSTVCPFPAFAEATISLSADGSEQKWALFQGIMPHLQHVHVANAMRVLRDDDKLTASAAGLVPSVPPVEWFTNPELSDLTPLTVTDDGRVYGHAWPWGECHIGVQGECTVAPHSNTGYAYYLLKELETADGSKVEVGTITLDTNHAGQKLSWRDAAAHYDHTGTAVADVVFGEDEHGGWFAGALRPDASAEAVRKFSRGAVSGDWRRIHGNLELVGLLTVNVPGFPIPRTKALVAAGAEGLEVLALVAAGINTRNAPEVSEADKQVLAALASGEMGELSDLAAQARGEL